MMRILVGVVMGLLLMACQPKQVRHEEELMPDGRYFSITHTVKHRVKDVVYTKGRVKHVKRKQAQPDEDGAPSGPVPSFFKKIIPKREPISRYGNPAEYEVMGKQYDVMTSSTGYKSRGIASWYGTKFDKGRTSSGERYDMYALTAAHKTLPLPTYLRVRNLSNGKEAIVKVNDRGPFHPSRILDLSYAAAAKLGVFPKGTALVEIEALKTTKHPLHYYIQAGAFESSELAERLRVKLGRLTTSPVYVQKTGHQFLVQVGPFASKDMVSRLKQRLDSNDVRGSFSMLM